MPHNLLADMVIVLSNGFFVIQYYREPQEGSLSEWVLLCAWGTDWVAIKSEGVETSSVNPWSGPVQ